MYFLPLHYYSLLVEQKVDYKKYILTANITSDNLISVMLIFPAGPRAQLFFKAYIRFFCLNVNVSFSNSISLHIIGKSKPYAMSSLVAYKSRRC